MKSLQVNSFGPEDTLKIAENVGKNIVGGEVIELISDLGGGKTTFVRGLALGMGSKDMVRSPSFALEHVYKAGKFKLHHLDFYRLEDPGIMKEALEEAMQDRDRVIVVEWGDIVGHVLPAKRFKIEINAVLIDEREIIFKFPDNLEYLIENLTS
jgi:tRNA threonylcarbamoyladenosine biosynthesis protein TsaE